MKRLIALGFSLLVAASSVFAQGRDYIGHGRLVTNDAIGEALDRWQTGSVASSHVWGPTWNGELPNRAGDLVEFRLGAQIIAPDNLETPAAADRPYANAFSFGLHTHFGWRGAEVSAGADLTMTGDQTQLYRIQQAIHDVMGIPGPSDATRAAGIGNGVHPSAVVEVGRRFEMGAAQVRPFIEGRYGVENIARAGIDLSFGGAGRRDLMVRDPVSGQRYRVVKGEAPGFTFVLGADYAAVSESTYLPEPTFEPLDRTRVRAGVHWEGERTRLFYGLTWLSEEFEAQTEGQFIGSLRIDYAF